MSPREACNYAYFHVIKDMREEDRAARMAGHQFEESLNDRIERFEQKIGLRPDHEDIALWMHKNILLKHRGYSDEQIAAMFDEKKDADVLPRGVGEEHRWRFEDKEWDGLEDFQGNPWDLPGIDTIGKVVKGADREEEAKDARETL
jgi:hypothetical protein